MPDKRAYWIGFSRVVGIGPAKLRKLLDYFGDIEAAWQADAEELKQLGLDRRALQSLLDTRQQFDPVAELEALDKLSTRLLTWDDPDYPALLKMVPDPPFTLYVRGELLPRDEWALAVVGTRSASVYGKEATHRLVSGLADSGVTIVSGLALGIDTEAHSAALQAGGRTLAVLGSGVDCIYPRRNIKLSERIMAQGAIISEFPLGSQPESFNFPRRNRIISGLSLGVLFVEGSAKSGARITVDYALEHGREVLAVPGNILSRGSEGPNRIIQQGGKLVMDIGDILEELNLQMVPHHNEARTVMPASPEEAALLEQLSAEPMHVDELGLQTNIPAADVSSTLIMMELKGYVRHVGGMQYVRVHEQQASYRTHFRVSDDSVSEEE